MNHIRRVVVLQYVRMCSERMEEVTENYNISLYHFQYKMYFQVNSNKQTQQAHSTAVGIKF